MCYFRVWFYFTFTSHAWPVRGACLTAFMTSIYRLLYSGNLVQQVKKVLGEQRAAWSYFWGHFLRQIGSKKQNNLKIINMVLRTTKTEKRTHRKKYYLTNNEDVHLYSEKIKAAASNRQFRQFVKTWKPVFGRWLSFRQGINPIWFFIRIWFLLEPSNCRL